MTAPAVYRAADVYREAGRLFAAHIDLLYQCDLDCRHCYLDDKASHNHDTAFWKDVIDQLIEMDAMILTLSGGELFLRPDAMELIRYASDQGLVLNLKTHGGRITDAMVRELAACRIGVLEVSLYSHRPEVHDGITQRPGSHARTVAAMRSLIQAGIPTRASFIMMKENQGDAEGAADLCMHLGAQFQGSSDLHVAKSRDTFPLELVASDEARTQWRDLGPPELPEIGCGSAVAETWGEKRLCGAGHSSLYIDPQGVVTPCVMWPRPLGDLSQGTRLAALWSESEHLNEIRSWRNADRSTCQSCDHRSSCSYCPGKSFQEGRDPLGGSDTMCETTFMHARAAAADQGRPEPSLPSGLSKKPFRILNR